MRKQYEKENVSVKKCIFPFFGCQNLGVYPSIRVWKSQFAECYKIPPAKTVPPKDPIFQPAIPLKLKFPVHSHLEYMLHKVFKMIGVKLTIRRLLLIVIYWYQSTYRRFIHSHLLVHSQKGGLIMFLMVEPPLMRMYKQIRKLFLKLHLKKITSEIYANSWNSNCRFLGAKFINTSF